MKTQEINLEGDEFKIKKGALHRQLKVSKDFKFTKTGLRKLDKLEIGDKFEFEGNEFKMTKLMKKRITLALVLMRGSGKK